MDYQLRMQIVGLVMLIFGLAYAIIIAARPFKPGLTWLSVTIGDLVTDIGSFAVILLLTGNLVAALVPAAMHILTGGPMIIGQVIKHLTQNGGAVVLDPDEGTDGN